jgi:hypothetical protein
MTEVAVPDGTGDTRVIIHSKKITFIIKRKMILNPLPFLEDFNRRDYNDYGNSGGGAGGGGKH